MMKYRKSLRDRLITTYILIAFIPLLFAGIIIINMLNIQIKSDIFRNNDIVANSVAEQINKMLLSPSNDICFLGKTLSSNSTISDKEINILTDNLLKCDGFFSSIEVLDENGKLEHIAPFKKEYIGFDFSTNDYVQLPEKNNKLYFSKTFISPYTNTPTVAISYHIKDSIIIGYINLMQLNKSVLSTKLEHDAKISIVDENGTYIINSHLPLVLQRNTFPFFQHVKNNISKDVFSFEYEYKGKNNLLNVIPIPKARWTVIIDQPSESAFESVNYIKTIIIISIFVSIIIALLISIWSFRSITIPLSTLLKSIKRISSGRYNIPPDFMSFSELNSLSEHFNQMIEAIKNRELKLSQSEQKYKGLYNAVNGGVFVTDSNFNAIEANSTACKILGLTYNEECKIYNISEDIRFIKEDGADLLPDEYPDNMALRSGLPNHNTVVGLYDFRTSKFMWLLVNSEPIFDEQSHVITCAITSFVDITELKNTQQELLELNTHLEQKVNQRTTQLENANRELESFSYSVSHDLRAPLRAIDGFSRAIAEDYGDKLDATANAYFNRILNAVKRMSELIDDLLNLSRLNKAEIKIEKINMSDIVHQVAENLKLLSPERTIEFSIKSDVFAFGDKKLMQAVFENLLSNSIKFTSKHSNAKIEFGTFEENGETVYYIKDDGAGFNMDYENKLFGAFQRLHNNSEFEGNGIGLANVQRIIHRHNGKIWAEGQIEKGATFYFTLGFTE